MLDFFDAAREAARKQNAKVRYDKKGSFDLSEVIDFLGDCEDSRLFEKLWEVEPAPEKLVDFDEAFKAVRKGDQISLESSNNWSGYRRIEFKSGCSNGTFFIIKDSLEWWPTEEQMKGKWKIKPKVDEKKDVFVWGACDGDGDSYLYKEKPIYDATLYSWKEEIGDDNMIEFEKGNLFPKDKPQKYKVVPVDES